MYLLERAFNSNYSSFSVKLNLDSKFTIFS